MAEEFRMLVELGRSLQGTRLGPVAEALLVMGLGTRFVRFVFSSFPTLPAFLLSLAGQVGRAMRRGASRAAAWAISAIREATTYRHASEPRWVKPLVLGIDVVCGSYFAFTFFVLCLWSLLLVLYADANDLVLWKRIVLASMLPCLMVLMRVYTVQARDAFHQLRTGSWRNAANA
jgi:hypothetical protein